MKIARLLIIPGLLLIVFAFSSCNLPFLGKEKKAALQVTANPKATVFLDEEHVGQTPYFNEELKAGEYTLKLVPESGEESLLAWQGMIKLNPGVLTVVDRVLDASEDQSSGHSLTLEPIAEKEKVRLSVISIPDSAVVSVDGEPKGFTPLSLDDLSEDDHVFTISSNGYQERIIKGKTVKGYKLTINVQLAREKEAEETEAKEEDEEEEEKETEEKKSPLPSPKIDQPETEEATESAEEMEKPYVRIKATPTGWLNVRSEPSTAGGEKTILEEDGTKIRVNPGESYQFIEANESGSWYQIEYQPGKQGWISGSYATLYE